MEIRSMRLARLVRSVASEGDHRTSVVDASIHRAGLSAAGRLSLRSGRASEAVGHKRLSRVGSVGGGLHNLHSNEATDLRRRYVIGVIAALSSIGVRTALGPGLSGNGRGR